jgi:hypothetical protein
LLVGGGDAYVAEQMAEGCVKSDVAYELPVRVHGSVW